MSSFARLYSALLAIAISLLFCGCPTPSGPVDKGLLGQLQSLKAPPNLDSGATRQMVDTPIGDKTETGKPQTGTVNGAPVTYHFYTQRYSASAAFDTQMLLNPSTDVIYPGSVLLGHTIDSGTYQEVTTGAKKPVTVSFDLSGVTGAVSGTIVPSLSAYRELWNRILSQPHADHMTSSYCFEMQEIKSEQEMDLKVAANGKYSSGLYEASIKAGFDFNSTSIKKKYLIRFIQTFYTADVDQGAGTFLYEDYNLSDFGGYRPVYVASISYGRLAYLSMETDADAKTINTELNVAFSAMSKGSADVDVKAALSYLNSNTTTKITVIGGSQVAYDLGSFITMLTDDTFSKDNAGKIVAYKLRFVHDNAVANTVFNGEYTANIAKMVIGGGVDVTLSFSRLFVQAKDEGGSTGLDYYGRLRFGNKDLWVCTHDNYWHTQNGYNGSSGTGPQTINYDSLDDQTTIEVSGLYERDWWNADDDYQSPSTQPTIRGLQSGQTPITLTAYDNHDSNDYVSFEINVTVTPKY